MRRTLRLFAFAGALIVTATAFAADATLDKARQLLDRGDAQAAYALLEPLQSSRAGEIEYDLLLGAAAIDAKRPSEAVFALERVLAVNPDHPQARALIARAYFMLGEVKTAQQEFESLKQRPDVPQEARALIQKYLDAIEQVLSAERTKIAGYLEATVGHDTNVNSATSGNQIAIPFFGGALFTLSAAGTKASDNFLAAAGGVNLRHRFTRDAALIAGLDVNKRMNSRQDQFDTGYWNGNLGVNFTQERNNFTLGFQGQQFFVDNNRFRDAKGLIGQWQRLIDDASSFTVYLQHTRLDYPGQEIRNADRTVGGVGYARILGGERQPVIFAGAYAGEERERASGVPHLGHRLWGARLGGQMTLRENLVAFASVSYEDRSYGGADPLFLVTRGDNQTDLRLGLTYTPWKLWSITPQLAHTRNSSNIVISDFERTQAFITLRRDFR